LLFLAWSLRFFRQAAILRVDCSSWDQLQLAAVEEREGCLLLLPPPPTTSFTQRAGEVVREEAQRERRWGRVRSLEAFRAKVTQGGVAGVGERQIWDLEDFGREEGRDFKHFLTKGEGGGVEDDLGDWNVGCRRRRRRTRCVILLLHDLKKIIMPGLMVIVVIKLGGSKNQKTKEKEKKNPIFQRFTS